MPREWLNFRIVIFVTPSCGKYSKILNSNFHTYILNFRVKSLELRRTAVEKVRGGGGGVQGAGVENQVKKRCECVRDTSASVAL